MQPSAFSHEGAGNAQHNFYGQSPYGGAGTTGSGGAATGGGHHASYGQAPHSGYGHASHGEQSPSMSYLQQNAAHMGMYGGYGGHYPGHPSHASPQQHYSHVSGGAFPGAHGAPQSMLGGAGGDFHNSAYGHMAGQQGMYYQDPATGAVHMVGHHPHGTVPGMIPPIGTIAGNYNAVGHHASPPATGKGSKGGKGASGGRKGSTATTGKKAAAAAATAADPGAAAAPATGKAKSSKQTAGADRHHPYEGGAAPAAAAAAEKASKKKEKEPPKPPVLKSHLKQPKQAPSPWQVYFTEELQKIKAEQPGARLNVAHVAKDAGQRYAALPEEAKEEFKRRSQEAKEQYNRDVAAWKATLTPEDIKQENMFRTAQRKAGKSRKGNLKDPNAPKKPLSAYFLFLRAIRADPQKTEDVFHGEQETTKQSVLAAAKWRSLPEEEKQPFLEKAEADKVEYERLRKEYEQNHGLNSGAGGGSDGKGDGDDDDEQGFGYGGAGGNVASTGNAPGRGQPVPPSLAAGGGGADEPFKLDGHFGLGEDGDHLGFSSSKVEPSFGLEG